MMIVSVNNIRDDRVWHKGLVFRLKQHGITGYLLDRHTDYLSNKSQCVVIIRSCTSTLKPVHAGVPQGLVLWPLLFLIYDNDIAESLLSLIRLFADDNSSLFCSASSIAALQGIINHDYRFYLLGLNSGFYLSTL